MANNYEQYSTTIDNLTEAERAWLESLLEDPTDPDTGLDQFGDGFGFGGHVEIKGDTLYLYSMESIDGAVEVIQAFLAKFRPTSHHWFSWANTCSKPRPDEFGGGTVFITATDIHYLDAFAWVREQQLATT